MKKHQEEAKHTTKRCLLCVTDGCEEIETVTIFDTLRRAEGLEMVFARVPVGAAATSEELEVRLNQGLRIICDTHIDKVLNENFDMIILPGGPGAVRLLYL